MQIRSLAVTHRPLWFNFQDGNLESVTFNANVQFWPQDRKGIALFLLEFEENLPEQQLAEYGITWSAVGAYVYLQSPQVNGDFQQTILLPPSKVKRIGIRLWNAQEPLVLDKLCVTACGATATSEYGVSDGAMFNELDEFKAQPRPHLLPLSLLAQSDSCNAHCHAICRNWYDTMDDVARRYGTEDAGRINGVFTLDDGGTVPVTLFNGTPAMLRIPQTQANYLDRIGDKARNMVRKAQRQGYAYRKVDPNDYLDDVLEIRTSDPVRQGKPIPDYYKVRPTQMIDEPFCNGCDIHGEDFYGIFKDGKLVAYTTIFFYGELGQVNHILGHVDHLQEGVMNLLVSEMVREIIEHRPWVRAINYLYPHASKTNTGIGLFKRSIGFLPERVLVTHTAQDLNKYFAGPEESAEVKKSEPPSEKKAIRASTSKAVKVAATESEFIQPGKAKDRAQAIELALRRLHELRPASKLVRCTAPSVLTSEEFEGSSVYTVVFDGIPFKGLQDFLASGLKGYRNIVPKESFLLFDFKRAPDQNYVVKNSGFANLISRILRTEDRRINQELMNYLSKRFKSINLSVDDIRTGFKGSDYVLAGVVDFESQNLQRDFDSLLILRKIR